MIVENTINIGLEIEEVDTLDETMGIIENLMSILEETGNSGVAEYYSMFDTFNKIAEIKSAFEEKYLLELKTL